MKKKKPINPAKYEQEWREFNRSLKSNRWEPISLQAYIDYLHGKPLVQKLSKSNASIKSKLPSYRIPPELDHSKYKSATYNSYHPTKKSIMDPVSLSKESEETRTEIIAKSKRIAIAYSKGAYQYVSDGTDPTTIGRKNI